uniref:Methionyl-tRNA formyltransferase n=1 Tax=Candidatus Kentrum sp. MB TaxID=2138164 RepID=A0A450XET1_9GAMM|nr:MAG: methionyl-tRNA formyltransferase [Candidatus Kentron sp. MB]VFK30227.1 MAG: methionyl-tRNA formyltransferase [Candidatus Kentron sp. MB]VFK75143.1 MAG: methionyl-tRNA formyltransferase [Candidatus Kentron sp. MB]
MDRSSFVIVSDRPWNKIMLEHLRDRTGWLCESILEPTKLTVEHLTTIDPRYLFFPHWSHRIEPEIFTRFECVIFHMTDLPFGRGGSPLQNLIARGIYETKITALRCVEALDAGPVYLKRPLSLHGAAEEIFLRASAIMEDMIVDIVNIHPTPIPQQETPTVFKRRTPAQGNLEKAKTLKEAFDLIRMLDAEGYPHAWLEAGPFRLEFTRAARKTDCLLADVRITLSKSE